VLGGVNQVQEGKDPAGGDGGHAHGAVRVRGDQGATGDRQHNAGEQAAGGHHHLQPRVASGRPRQVHPRLRNERGDNRAGGDGQDGDPAAVRAEEDSEGQVPLHGGRDQRRPAGEASAQGGWLVLEAQGEAQRVAESARRGDESGGVSARRR